MKKKKLPADLNQKAFAIMELATSEDEPTTETPPKKEEPTKKPRRCRAWPPWRIKGRESPRREDDPQRTLRVRQESRECPVGEKTVTYKRTPYVFSHMRHMLDIFIFNCYNTLHGHAM